MINGSERIRGKMAIVAVDIDQTLYDFDAQIREAFFELAIERDDKSLLRGAYSTNMEWRNLTDVLGVETALEAIHWVHDRTRKQIPFQGAEKTINKLWTAGHEIKYVTSRREKYRSDTEDWLFYDYMFPSGEVICSEHDKSEHLFNCQYLIDDRPYTIVNFVYDYEWQYRQEIGLEDGDRKAFGIWTPYNRNLTDIKGVYLAPTWRGLDFYLERKGVI